MCGIVAYCGSKQTAGTIVFDGLKKLEYRGYDSWGIWVYDQFIVKKVGKISQTEDLSFPKSSIALGHTRWATHGGISEKNSHPHLSFHKRLVVAHNGVLENYAQIKQSLLQKGYQFQSETDTEVLANLLEDILTNESDYRIALSKFSSVIRGRNAAVFYDFQTDQLSGLRQGSPLVLGIDSQDYYLSSDVTPFLEFTKQAVFLDDGEAVVIKKQDHQFFNLQTQQNISKTPFILSFDAAKVEKGDKHSFLEKEIWEQPEVLKDTIKQPQESLQKAASLIKKAEHIYCIGAGTAFQVASWGAFLLQSIAHRNAQAVIASEFGSIAQFVNSNDVIIAVTQSGETADTLSALQLAQTKGAKVIALVNVEGSTIYRIADVSLLHRVGVEKAVASTKATTAPMLLFALLCQELVPEADLPISKLLETIAVFINSSLVEQTRQLAHRLKDSPNLYLIGRGASYPLAREGSIKIQEVSNLHAEGVAGGELKHYAISLIEKDVPCFVIVSEDQERSAILSNAAEVKARGGFIIGFDSEKNDVFDEYFSLPDLGILKSITTLIPLQLLAYYLAVERHCDPDYCRNLAKSVTVI